MFRTKPNIFFIFLIFLFFIFLIFLQHPRLVEDSAVTSPGRAGVKTKHGKCENMSKHARFLFENEIKENGATPFPFFMFRTKPIFSFFVFFLFS
jgi:hypothetical protein